MAQRWIARDFGEPEVLEIEDFDVPAPGPGEVTIEVRATGLNPVDYKVFGGARGDRSVLPLQVGGEAAGVVTAVGPQTEIGSGPVAVGDEVVAFRISGALATSVTVPAKDVFAKPATLSFSSAANLLLVATTAADELRVVPAHSGTTVLVHGASAAVGVSLLQQIALVGDVRVIGTASEQNFDLVRRFGAEPVAYGDGLLERVRQLAPEGIDAAYDEVGTEEAIDVSLALVDKSRLVTIANAARAGADGFAHVGGGKPESAQFRDQIRGRLIELAAGGKLEVPVSRTFPFAQAPAAYTLLKTGHPGGKLAVLA